MASINTMTKPVRPYTEYNIFFQLEREYILQVLLSVEPTYEPCDVFHPETDTHYKGPRLPPRYSGLVLQNDWYVPGKARRRKRRHRKSHGAIGFHELTLKIAEAWPLADVETRAFCACLGDVGVMEYKNLMKQYKKMENKMEIVGDVNPDESNTSISKTSSKCTSKPQVKRIKKVEKNTQAFESDPKKCQGNQSEQVQQIQEQNHILRHVSYMDDDCSTEMEPISIFPNQVAASPFSNDDFNNESDDIFNNSFNNNSFNEINNGPNNDSNHGTHSDNFGSTYDEEVNKCISYFFSEDEEQSSNSVEARTRNDQATSSDDKISFFVDMEDDEIMDLWHAQFTHKSNKTGNANENKNNYDCKTYSQTNNLEYMRYMLSKTQSHLNQIVHRNFMACSA